MKKPQWKKIRIGTNEVLEGGRFYVSYNPDTLSSPFGLVMDIILSDVIGERVGGEETALCNRETGDFYILNGDFRKEYEKLVPKGFDACYKFYLSKIENRSAASTDKL